MSVPDHCLSFCFFLSHYFDYKIDFRFHSNQDSPKTGDHGYVGPFPISMVLRAEGSPWALASQLDTES